MADKQPGKILRICVTMHERFQEFKDPKHLKLLKARTYMNNHTHGHTGDL